MSSVAQTRSLLRDSFGSFVLKASNALLAIAFTLLAAFWLTPIQFGRFSVFQSVFVVSAVAALFGADQVVLRQFSRQENVDELARGILRMLVAIGVGLALLFLVLQLWLTFPSEVVVLGFVFVLSFAVIRVTKSVRVAAGDVLIGQVPESVLQPVIAVALISLLIGFGVTPTETRSYGVFVFGFFIAAMVSVQLSRRELPIFFGRHAKSSINKSFVLGAPFALIAMSNILLSQLDVLLLASLAGPLEAGVGRLLIRLADFSSFAIMAAAVPVARWASKIDQMADPALDDLRKRVAQVTLASFLFALAYGAIIYLTGDWLLSKINDDYRGYTFELAVILLGRVLMCWYGLPTVFLAMQGHMRAVVVCQVVGIVSNILISIALIPKLGVLGAAIGTSASIMIWKALACHYLKRTTGLGMTLRLLFTRRWSRS